MNILKDFLKIILISLNLLSFCGNFVGYHLLDHLPKHFKGLKKYFIYFKDVEKGISWSFISDFDDFNGFANLQKDFKGL